MKRTLVSSSLWLLVTVTSVLIANAAVGMVRDQVSDAPTAVAPATAPSVITATASGSSTTATTLPASTSSSSTSSVDTTTSSTSTTTAATTTRPVATSTPPATTTTTTSGGEIRTYSTPGGTVSIEVYPDHLVLLGAVPASGYSVAETESSSTHIEIEFKSGGHEVKFHAELSGGEIQVEVDTGDD